MSKNVTFVLNKPGLIELMKSGEMQGVLNAGASAILGACGEGYEIESAHPINYIAIAAVRAVTYKAKLDNNKNNTLIKAKGSAKI